MDADHAGAAEQARRRAAAWCDAWNRRDLVAVMAHYAEDVAFSSPTVVRRWNSADGWLHAHFETGMQAPGLRFALVELDGVGKAVRVVACYGEGGTPPGKGRRSRMAS